MKEFLMITRDGDRVSIDTSISNVRDILAVLQVVSNNFLNATLDRLDRLVAEEANKPNLVEGEEVNNMESHRQDNPVGEE